MEELPKSLIDSAKKDRRGLIRLKNALVTLNEFEFASKLRELELKHFPETDEVKQATKKAKEINLVLRMVDLSVSEDKCWLIYQTLKLYEKKKGNFSTEDAAKLRCKEVELFFAQQSEF